jgi:hypothetical protein
MRIHTMLVLFFCSLFLQAQPTATGKAVTVAKIPAAWIVVRDVQGGYDLHAQTFRSLMEYAGTTFRGAGNYFGIYPADPDAAKGGHLHWQAAVRVVPGPPSGHGDTVALRTEPYSMRQL